MINYHILNAEFSRFTELRRRLIEADPEIDEGTLLDTLEGATSLHEALGEVIRVALMEEAMADGLKTRLAQMKERLERIETACARKREVAQAVMEEAGIEKLTEPDFTVSLRASPPGVMVTDEAAVPEWFWVPQPPKLDRKRILDCLKAGTHVAGTELSNSR